MQQDTKKSADARHPSLPENLATSKVHKHFKLGSVLSQDETGTLYAAGAKLKGKDVAVNVLEPNYKVISKRLIKIEHPNICKAHKVLKLSDGALAIIIDRPEGKPIMEFMGDKDTEFSLSQALSAILQLLSALHAIHRTKKTARNLSVNNLFLYLDENENLRLKLVSCSIGGTGVNLRAPHYQSPERVMNIDKDDPRSDIWAAGAILYHLLFRRPLFSGDDSTEIAQKNLLEEPDFTAGGVALPEDLIAVLKKALSRDEKERYQTVPDMVGDLLPLRKLYNEPMSDDVSSALRKSYPPPAPDQASAQKKKKGLLSGIASRRAPRKDPTVEYGSKQKPAEDAPNAITPEKKPEKPEAKRVKKTLLYQSAKGADESNGPSAVSKPGRNKRTLLGMPAMDEASIRKEAEKRAAKRSVENGQENIGQAPKKGGKGETPSGKAAAKHGDGLEEKIEAKLKDKLAEKAEAKLKDKTAGKAGGTLKAKSKVGLRHRTKVKPSVTAQSKRDVKTAATAEPKPRHRPKEKAGSNPKGRQDRSSDFFSPRSILGSEEEIKNLEQEMDFLEAKDDGDVPTLVVNPDTFSAFADKINELTADDEEPGAGKPTDDTSGKPTTPPPAGESDEKKKGAKRRSKFGLKKKSKPISKLKSKSAKTADTARARSDDRDTLEVDDAPHTRETLEVEAGANAESASGGGGVAGSKFPIKKKVGHAGPAAGATSKGQDAADPRLTPVVSVDDPVEGPHASESASGEGPSLEAERKEEHTEEIDYLEMVEERRGPPEVPAVASQQVQSGEAGAVNRGSRRRFIAAGVAGGVAVLIAIVGVVVMRAPGKPNEDVAKAHNPFDLSKPAGTDANDAHQGAVASSETSPPGSEVAAAAVPHGEASPSETTDTSAEAPKKEMVSIELIGVPENSVITVNGSPSGVPIEMVRSETPITISVSAEGFKPFNTDVVLNKDKEVAIDLEKLSMEQAREAPTDRTNKPKKKKKKKNKRSDKAVKKKEGPLVSNPFKM